MQMSYHMTFARPLYTHGFSLLQSGRIKLLGGVLGRQKNGQRLTMHTYAESVRPRRNAGWPPMSSRRRPGRWRRHRNEIDKTRRASDSRTSIIQCDRGRENVDRHDGRRLRSTAAVCPCNAPSTAHGERSGRRQGVVQYRR